MDSEKRTFDFICSICGNNKLISQRRLSPSFVAVSGSGLSGYRSTSKLRAIGYCC